MDEKTYESLKKIIGYLYDSLVSTHPLYQDIDQVAGWIDEVAKDY